MRAQSERGSTAGLAGSAELDWLDNSGWQGPSKEISGIKSSASITAVITAVSYHRGGGEATWCGDRHRMGVTLDQLPPLLRTFTGWTAPALPGAPLHLHWKRLALLTPYRSPGARFVT
jgi:hypothetical protein